MDSVTLQNSTTLLSTVTDRLCKDFEILNGFNLLDFDSSMQSLKDILSGYESYCFNSNQRLVFTLYDTDYYFLNSKVGFTTQNLLQLLVDLDISLSYCLLFTNHIGLKKELENLCLNYFNLQDCIKVFENNYSTWTLTDKKTKFNRSADDIQFHFCFLSHIKRNHRLLTRTFLKINNLDSKTLLAWHSNPMLSDIKKINKVGKKSSEPSVFVQTFPYSRVKDKIYTDSRLAYLYDNFDIVNRSEINKQILTDPNEQNFKATFLKYCFVNIVTETVFDFPYPYITEKTFKCFWHKSPFIIVGAPNSLAHLRSLGFKTYQDFWDESYDSELDCTERLIKVFNVIKTISNWSINDCKDVYNSMTNILNYNYNHYFENYTDNDLLKFLEQKNF
jgi:hypothetical protein